MPKITYTHEQNVTDEQLTDMLTGTCWWNWEWWKDFHITRVDGEDGDIKSVMVEHSDQYDETRSVVSIVPLSALLVAIGEVMEEGCCCTVDMLEDVSMGCAQDIDLVMQRAVYGGVVFG